MRLEGSGGVVYQMIPSVNETAEGVVRTEFSVDCYNISVVDWEEDGSIGSLGVPQSTIITITPLSSTNLNCSDKRQEGIYVIGLALSSVQFTHHHFIDLSTPSLKLLLTVIIVVVVGVIGVVSIAIATAIRERRLLIFSGMTSFHGRIHADQKKSCILHN